MMRKRGKKFNPERARVMRAAAADMFARAIDRASDLGEEDATRLETAHLAALASLSDGVGTTNDYNALVECITIARVISEKMKDEETAEACFVAANDGMHALNSVRARYMQDKSLSLTKPEHDALSCAIDLYAQLMRVCKRGEIIDALHAARAEIKAATSAQAPH